jgi:hypothetical protein
MQKRKLHLKFSPHLLWEYDLTTFDYDKSKAIIIERVIQRGNLKDWQIAIEMYGKDAFLQVIEHSNQLSDRDRNFTKLIIDSPLINALPPLIIEDLLLATTLDISAMKLNAIVNSGQRIKDFIDIFYLLTYHSLNELLEAYSQKYSYSNSIVALKALNYFEDINPDADPPKMKDGLPLSTIKKRIQEAASDPDRIFKHL